jgi:hypothetical protein
MIHIAILSGAVSIGKKKFGAIRSLRLVTVPLKRFGVIIVVLYNVLVLVLGHLTCYWA